MMYQDISVSSGPLLGSVICSLGLFATPNSDPRCITVTSYQYFNKTHLIVTFFLNCSVLDSLLKINYAGLATLCKKSNLAILTGITFFFISFYRLLWKELTAVRFMNMVYFLYSGLPQWPFSIVS